MGAVSILINVINNDIAPVKVVGLVGAGELNDAGDGEIHGSVRVDAHKGVDGLTENGLGARVSATGGGGEGGGEGDLDEGGVESRSLGEDEVNGKHRVLHRDGEGVRTLVVDGLSGEGTGRDASGSVRLARKRQRKSKKSQEKHVSHVAPPCRTAPSQA